MTRYRGGRPLTLADLIAGKEAVLAADPDPMLTMTVTCQQCGSRARGRQAWGIWEERTLCAACIVKRLPPEFVG